MASGRPRGRLNGVDIKPEVLRQGRLRARLSLAQVAGGELTRQAVHLIETGKVRPSMRSLQIITDRLAIPIRGVLVGPPGSPRDGVDIKPGVLREARAHAQLSLAQVAAEVGLTRQAVHLIETGKVRPSWQSLRDITRRLSIPVEAALAETAKGDRRREPVSELETLVQTQHYDRAVERASEMLRLNQEQPDTALIQYHLGHALCKLGRPMEALDRLQLARDYFESDGNEGLAIDAMEVQALALHIAEKPDLALAMVEQALERHRSRPDSPPRETEARLLERIGTVLAGRGDFLGARARYEEALDAAGGVRDLARVARIYHGLGMCQLRLGDIERATDLMVKAETLYEAEERINQTRATDLPRVQNDLALVLMKAGDLSRAERRLQSALQRFVEMRVERVRSQMLLSLAELRHLQRRYDEGVSFVLEAMELARRFNEPRALATAYAQLGELQAARGEQDLAIESLERALAILEEAGFEERRTECLRVYERIAAQRKGQDPAAQSAG